MRDWINRLWQEWMNRIARYILRQLALSTVLVVVTLTAAIWLTQSLRFVDWIVNRGLPLSTFIYIAVLVLPSFLVVILPIALFAAVLFTYNKMQSDSEIIVLRAVGVGPGQLMAPALMVATLVMLVSYALNLYLLPLSYRGFKDLQAQIRSNYSSVLLQDGVFTTIDEGVTMFVREQGPRGELLGIMIHDGRVKDKPVTMIADRGAIVNTAEGPRIVMVNGNRQELDATTGKVSFLFFDRYTVELSRSSKAAEAVRFRESTERFIGELLDPTDVDDPRVRAALRADGHQRLASPLYSYTFVLVALAALLSGEFSRRGQAIRVIAAVAVVVAIQALGIGFANLSSKVPALTVLIYLNTILPAALALYFLFGHRILPRRAAGAPA
ncbi:MAG TPA: LPS export ABC transporter permease LptF [Candidatus Sulfotelmatobacter sp.]|nr:LPS export ABC transporter permease LptF [Candidatus Sulfotelmatobacter sp.]